MEDNSDWRLQSDWYSPTRLHNSPVEFDFPKMKEFILKGDRFIPNRSLMDLDQAHNLLTNKTTESDKPKFSENYRKKLRESLTLDIEGRPFQMLVFRGSPRTTKKSGRLIDEMKRNDHEGFNHKPSLHLRNFPEKESRILDAPKLMDDFYMNIMDWGSSNHLAIALGLDVYTFNASNSAICKLGHMDGEGDFPTSLSWSEDAKTLAVGHMCSDVQLFDAETSKPIRILRGHRKRVGSVTWNGPILTSGSYDKAIVSHDVRVRNSVTSYMKVHKGEVCGLKWSPTGNVLASGGNDNRIYIWDASKMTSSSYMYCLNEHLAGVKALAWCPYNYDVLASGGGLKDGCIKLWNLQKGTCINSISTQTQITGLQWNRHHKEILSGHGYGLQSSALQSQLCLWNYPSMSKVETSMQHQSRVLHLSQSPDGLTALSAGADETLRFWEIFGPAKFEKSRSGSLGSLLSLKESPIR